MDDLEFDLLIFNLDEFLLIFEGLSLTTPLGPDLVFKGENLDLEAIYQSINYSLTTCY